ncbi:MAG: hypothetical protein SGI83_00635 [Bacteroidota bacterium]|nr:hypothetical protein [Bacteroidota bacterium]
MKHLFILLLFPLLSASNCKKKNSTGSLPACVKKMIDEGSKGTSPRSIPEQVDEYRYKGKTVFLITAPCCDQYNVVYDENCNRICAAFGGITGKGDGLCEDFSTTAEHVKLLWKKPAE